MLIAERGRAKKVVAARPGSSDPRPAGVLRFVHGRIGFGEQLGSRAPRPAGPYPDAGPDLESLFADDDGVGHGRLDA